MWNRFGIASLTVVTLATLAGAAHADDERISVEKLPAAIKKSIKKKFQKAEIEKATKEVEHGKTIYEVLLEIDDRPVEVAFTADGSILEIEKVIPFEQVPARVKKALAKKYPAAKITKVEAVTKGEDGPTVYEIAINTDVVLDGKGKFVKTTEEENEKPSAKATKPKKHDDEGDDDEGETNGKGKKGEKK